MDYIQLEEFLADKGYNPLTRAKVTGLCRQAEAAHLLRQKADDDLVTGDNPWAEVIDEMIGEPLREWNSLVKECKETNGKAFVLCSAFAMSELDAKVEAFIAKADAGLDLLDDELDQLEAMMSA